MSDAIVFKLKRGDKRHDGMVFWRYRSGKTLSGERWETEEKFKILQEKENKRVFAWVELNREKRKKIQKKYHRLNRDKIILRNRKYRKNNNHIRIAWRARNKALVASLNAKRRALKKSSIHPSHDSFKEIILFEIAKKHKIELDHIVPLSRGGFHWHENLRLLPRSLNLQKGSKLDCELTEEQQEKVEFWKYFTELVIK